ncbi:MAG: YitT family protein [Athalassotoga sp.]|uniref:YitT family protein n=2 Tax=Athalassotoga sp. TaxID=2022597 RepID=UPI003D03E8DE
MKNLKFWMITKEYFLISAGDLITAVGVVAFLVPYNIAAGGASGLAIILHGLLPMIQIGVWMYIINGILILISILILGIDFSFKTIYSTFLLSFFVDLLNNIFPIPVYTGGDLMLATIFGSIITAFGMAIAFSQNGSTGGTDIVAKLFNRFFSIPLGQGVLIADVAIGILSGFQYGVNIGMYAILAIVLNGLSIDFLMRGMEMSKQLFIISSKNEEIENYITQKTGHTVTYIPTIGAHSRKEYKMIMVVVKRREVSSILDVIKAIDPSAFVIVEDIDKAFGEGFNDINKL